MMRTLILLSAGLFISLSPPGLSAETQESSSILRFEPVDASRDRTIPVKIYLPASDQPCPVILFSHGLGGSRENSSYLGNHWAAAGYASVFVQHVGSDEEVWKSVTSANRMDALKQAASLKSSLDRTADIPFIIDRLEEWNAAADHPIKGRLNLERIGLCGHSFGAATTQALMGQMFPLNRSFADSRIDAFFAMSPSASRGVSQEKAFGHITAPVLCMTGTEDTSPINPETTAESRKAVYAALPPKDKYQLVFEEKRNAHHHPAIQKISTQFWNAYLKDESAAKSWLQSSASVQDCGLLEKDIWEWK
jgi:predicted dienelactone hydrolase